MLGNSSYYPMLLVISGNTVIGNIMLLVNKETDYEMSLCVKKQFDGKQFCMYISHSCQKLVLGMSKHLKNFKVVAVTIYTLLHFSKLR